MRNAEDGALGDGRVGSQHLLDLARVNVEAADEHQLLAPVDQPQVAVGVGHGDVAGREPAIGVGTFDTVRPVAGEQVRAADDDLTGVTLLDLLAALVEQPQLDAGQRATDRAGFGDLAHQGGGQNRGGLGKSVALEDVVARRVQDAMQHRRWQGRGSGQRHPYGGEGPLDVREHRPGDPHRRGPDEAGHGVPTDQLEGLHRVEALGEDTRRSAVRDHPQRSVEPVHVEQRQHEQHHVVAAHDGWLDGGRLLQVGQQRPVAKHRAAGSTAGPRGVQHDGKVFATPDGVGHSGAIERGEVGHDVLRRGVQLLDGAPGGRDHEAGTAVPQHVQQLGGGVAGVDRDGHQAGPQDGEVKDDEVGDVAEVDSHPVTGRQPQGLQPTGHASDPVLQLPPAQHLCPAEQGRLSGGAGGGRRDEVSQVAAGRDAVKRVVAGRVAVKRVVAGRVAVSQCRHEVPLRSGGAAAAQHDTGIGRSGPCDRPVRPL